MSTWLVPREGLTTEQLRAVELDTRQNHIILGGPGSGKTMVLLHRADYLRRKFGTPAVRHHIFVYTKALKEYIRSALWALDLPDDCVSTLHGWCVKYYRTHIGRRLPKNEQKDSLDFNAVCNAVLKHVSQTFKRGDPLFDFVVVDEGQDLDMDAFALLRVLSRHVTVCMDHKQQIYNAGSTEKQAAAALDIRKGDFILLDTFRCSRFIVELSGQFIADSMERKNYFRQTRVQEINIETPVLYYARNFEDERSRLIEVVASRMKFDERIGVVFPKKDQVHGFAKAMAVAGLEVEAQDGNINFQTDLPKFLTYHSAKGLTFDTVIMPRLAPQSFLRVPPDLLERQLFVGITRARKWVYMSTDRNRPLTQLRRLGELADQGMLTIKTPTELEQQSLFDQPETDKPVHIKVKKDQDNPELPDIL